MNLKNTTNIFSLKNKLKFPCVCKKFVIPLYNNHQKSNLI